MDAKPVTLSEILPGEGQYIIPVFQRYYSWEKANWETLWEDIAKVIEDGDPRYTHFIGPMIVFRETYPYDIARYMVVDGQQRLITLTLLLCSLRDVAKENNLPDLASAIVNNYVSFTTGKGELEYRLVPRSADRDALLSVIQGKIPPKASEDTVIQAYMFFRELVRSDLQRATLSTLEHLNALYEAITRRLRLISITLDNSDDPSKIYESMNFKFEQLLDADLIRNYVLMQLSISDQDEFHNTRWMTFESLFARNGAGQPDTKELEDFYYRYLIAQTDYFPKRKVYYEFRRYLSKFIAGKSGVDLKNSLAELVTSLKRYARYYRAVVHPDLAKDPDLKLAFQRFAFLDVKTAIPFMMSLYGRYEDETQADHISKDTFIRMINAVECFTIRRSILRERTRGYGSDFAQAVKKSSSLPELWRHFDSRTWPEDDAIVETLPTFELYARESKKARLILRQLETYFGHKEPVDLSDPRRITIEHILPQSLTAEWEAMLGEDAADLHEMYVNTIGNLTLTGYNQELGTKSFPDKKAEYAKHGSHIELNNYILKQDQWTEAEITERAKLLTERFIEIWPRPATPKQKES